MDYACPFESFLGTLDQKRCVFFMLVSRFLSGDVFGLNLDVLGSISFLV